MTVEMERGGGDFVWPDVVWPDPMQGGVGDGEKGGERERERERVVEGQRRRERGEGGEGEGDKVGFLRLVLGLFKRLGVGRCWLGSLVRLYGSIMLIWRNVIGRFEGEGGRVVEGEGEVET